MMSLYPSFSSTINMMWGAVPAAGDAAAASATDELMPAPRATTAVVRAATGRATPNAPPSVSVTAPRTLSATLATTPEARAGLSPLLVMPPSRMNHIDEAGAHASLVDAV